ncbi:GNAT family N-acetyltransferase [Paenibacillus sp. FSL R7-0652]|uniref:GNAT family N-acetyltransferase n=1 Tax=Paenibacillus sp. FSL R7-0652 TaxID=2921687 RepID=UPI00315A8E02
MHIRLLEHKDQINIEKIMSEYPLQFPTFIIDQYPVRWSKFLVPREENDAEGYYVAIGDNNETIGHAGYLYNEQLRLYEIVGVVVKKGVQRQGIGVALINTILETIKKMNEKEIILYTLGHVGNEDTIQFYNNIGFELTAYERDFFRTDYHRVTFTKTLS